MQIEGVIISKVFSPVSKFDTKRLLFSLIAKHNWSKISSDTRAAFLDAPLDQEFMSSNRRDLK